MANRFPLIVNAVSQKIEELISGDNLELTGNNIVISGDTGSGKYLTSDGSVVSWGVPGDVYLTQSQTLTNKTLEVCTISGSLNTITNLPNTALVNSTITVNGTPIPLGGTVSTPNDDTTYAVSMGDGASANVKKLILTAGGSGSGTDEVNFAVGTPNTIPSGSNAIVLAIDRVDDTVTISGTAPDADTITTLQAAVGGTAQSGDITIAASGSSTVSQNPANKTITINSTYVDTITKIRATTGQVLNPGNFTFLGSGATSVAQGVDVEFLRISRIITSSHSFEYVGAGTDINRANPFQGGEPIPENEIVAINGGQVPFTSTDQKGNFRIGSGLEINQTTSTISGRDFNRAIQANLTPLILALGG